MKRKNRYPSEIDRFWSKVNKTDNTEDCWTWNASTRAKGYGAFCYLKDGQTINGRGHRYSYEIHIGVIPDGLFVLHRCDNPSCVNPNHLFLGTNQDNVNDMMRKGRHVSGGTYAKDKAKYNRGSKHFNAKLTEDIVRSIRQEYIPNKIGYIKLAKKYNITVSHATLIIKNKIWKSI